MQLSKHIQHWLIILAFLSGSYFLSRLNEKPIVFITKQESTFNVDSNFLLYFNLGQKRLISSLLWIATILESDHDHYKNKDLNSWMFLRFKNISIIEPEFKLTYSFGGPYLSIIKDDLEGASYIYDRGLSMFPMDQNLLYNAGFHYYFEVGDFDKAYPILKKLNTFSNNSPMMVSTLARLEANSGNLNDAFMVLSQYQDSFPKDSIVWKKIYEYRYSLKAEIDLNCLNNKLSNCSMADLDNNPYIFKKDQFYSQKEWIPFKRNVAKSRQE